MTYRLKYANNRFLIFKAELDKSVFIQLLLILMSNKFAQYKFKKSYRLYYLTQCVVAIGITLTMWQQAPEQISIYKKNRFDFWNSRYFVASLSHDIGSCASAGSAPGHAALTVNCRYECLYALHCRLYEFLLPRYRQHKNLKCRFFLLVIGLKFSQNNIIFDDVFPNQSGVRLFQRSRLVSDYWASGVSFFVCHKW